MIEVRPERLLRGSGNSSTRRGRSDDDEGLIRVVEPVGGGRGCVVVRVAASAVRAAVRVVAFPLRLRVGRESVLIVVDSL